MNTGRGLLYVGALIIGLGGLAAVAWTLIEGVRLLEEDRPMAGFSLLIWPFIAIAFIAGAFL